MSIPLDSVCGIIGIELPAGAEKTVITGVAALQDAGSGDITFLSNTRYTRYLTETNATAVLVPPGVSVPQDIVALVTDDPYVAFLKVLTLFDNRSLKNVADGIDSSAVISSDAEIMENVSIGPNAVISAGVSIGAGTVIGPGVVVLPDVSIGDGCLLYPNVTIMDGCSVGNHVILHAGVVIGSDGFGFAPQGDGFVKIPQIGIVRIEDDVEIGANTCIDRAVFGETVISCGTKLDNLIQVAHNVHIGRSSVVASQAGISGSTIIGSGVKIGGQAGFAGHLHVGDGASIGAQAGVTKDVADGNTVSGYPAKDHMQAMRLEAALRQLPELIKTIKRQERRIIELERIISEQDEGDA